MLVNSSKVRELLKLNYQRIESTQHKHLKEADTESQSILHFLSRRFLWWICLALDRLLQREAVLTCTLVSLARRRRTCTCCLKKTAELKLSRNWISLLMAEICWRWLWQLIILLQRVDWGWVLGMSTLCDRMICCHSCQAPESLGGCFFRSGNSW